MAQVVRLYQLATMQIEFSRGDFDSMGQVRERGLQVSWSQGPFWKLWAGLGKEGGWAKQTAKGCLVGIEKILGRCQVKKGSPLSKWCFIKRGIERTPARWPAYVGSRNLRRSAKWRHRHWISLNHSACILCVPAHCIRYYACHLPWNVHLLLTRTRRIIIMFPVGEENHLVIL